MAFWKAVVPRCGAAVSVRRAAEWRGVGEARTKMVRAASEGVMQKDKLGDAGESKGGQGWVRP